VIKRIFDIMLTLIGALFLFPVFLLTALMVKIKLGALLFFKLANKMIWFINHKDRIEPMGLASRRMAEEKFDMHKVNAQMLEIMGLS